MLLHWRRYVLTRSVHRALVGTGANVSGWKQNSPHSPLFIDRLYVVATAVCLVAAVPRSLNGLVTSGKMRSGEREFDFLLQHVEALIGYSDS